MPGSIELRCSVLRKMLEYEYAIVKLTLILLRLCCRGLGMSLSIVMSQPVLHVCVPFNICLDTFVFCGDVVW